MYVYYVIGSLAYLIYMGIGIAYFLLPRSIAQYTIIFSPIVGYSVATLFAWYCYELDVPGSNIYAPFSLFLPSIINIYALNKYRSSRRLEPGGLDTDWTPLLPACVGLAFISFPFMINPFSPTTMTTGNNDIADYATMSRLLQEFPRSTEIGFLGQFGGIRRLCDGQWFGPAAITALFASVLNTEPYRIQSLSVNLFFALGIPFVYLFTKQVLKIDRKYSVTIAVLYAISPAMYRVVYDGFQGQLTGTTIVPGLLVISVMCVETAKRIDRFKFLPLLIIFNWALLISYSYTIIFAYGVILLYLLSFALIHRAFREAIVTVGILFAGILSSLALSPFRLKMMLHVQLGYATAKAGYFIGLLTPERLIGLFGSDVFSVTAIPYQNWWIWAIIGMSLSIGALRSWRDGNRTLSPLLVPLLIIYAAAIALFLSANGEQRVFSSYKAFKVSLLLPIYLCVIMGAFYFAVDKLGKSLKRSIMVAVIAVLLFGNGYSSMKIMKHLISAGSYVTADMADLRKFDFDPRIDSINIFTYEPWAYLWENYFLMHKKLYFSNTWYARPQGPPRGDFDLVERSGQRDIITVQSSRNESEIFLNETYWLVKKATSRRPLVKLGDGWWGREPTHRWTGSAGDTFSLELDSDVEDMTVDLDVLGEPAVQGNMLTVFLNDKQVESEQTDHTLIVHKLCLMRGKNILKFKMSVPPRRLSQADPRALGYFIRRVTIVAN